MEMGERDGVVGAMWRSVNVVALCESGGCSSLSANFNSDVSGNRFVRAQLRCSGQRLPM